MKILVCKNKVKRIKIIVKPEPVQTITSKDAKAETRKIIKDLEDRRKKRIWEIPAARYGKCVLCRERRYLNVLIRHHGDPYLTCMVCGRKPYRQHRAALIKAGLHPSQGVIDVKGACE